MALMLLLVLFLVMLSITVWFRLQEGKGEEGMVKLRFRCTEDVVKETKDPQHPGVAILLYSAVLTPAETDESYVHGSPFMVAFREPHLFEAGRDYDLLVQEVTEAG